MNQLLSNEGIGLVGAMILLGLLGVFALVAAQLATTEQRTTYNEFLHVSSFMSADSGGEAAIGWLRNYPGAPPIPNLGVDNRVASRGMTNIHSSQRFAYDMEFLQMSPRAGSAERYPDFWFSVAANGESGTNGSSNVEMVVKKQVQIGY
jgi:hypothetical protein